MPKFFFQANEINNNEIILSGETAHHIRNVLRCKPGDLITLSDGCCNDYICELRSYINKDKSICLTILNKDNCDTELPFHITLYQSLPKSDKMDFIVQKCIELGTSKIIPVITSRVIAHHRKTMDKINRLSRIAESAAGQSMRGIIPIVLPPVDFIQLVSTNPSEPLWLIADENEKHTRIKDVLSSRTASDIGIWIGPEGGFAPHEIESLQNCHAFSISLGRRILRTETAGIAAISQIIGFWEELSQ